MSEMGMKKVVASSFDATLEAAVAALSTEGFGVLTDIDVKETLKKKIDVDFRRYRILGACNPKLAHRVLSALPEIGVMLPCNVVVYENEGGGTTVIAFDPMTVVSDESPEVNAVAAEVRERLARVLAKL
jgi:uncharacterized protein (DUF302 family)